LDQESSPISFRKKTSTLTPVPAPLDAASVEDDTPMSVALHLGP
jgi:hypothetical protein